MKITAKRENILEGLTLVSSIASIRSPKPILQDLKLETKESALEVSSTDLEIGVRFIVQDVEIKEKGVCALPASRTAAIVKLLGSESIDITAEKESAVIKGGKSTFNLLGDNPEDFPDIPTFNNENYIAIGKDDFNCIVKRVSPAAATESTRYALNGIFLSLNKTKLTAVAADGKRLAKLECKVKPMQQLDDNIIVPTRAFSLFNSMRDEKDEQIKVSIDQRGCIIKGRRAEVFARLVEGHYPPYEDAIPGEFTRTAKIETASFERAMMQAALMTTEESKAVRLLFSEGGLKVTSYSAQTGRAEIEMDVDYTGDELEIAFNPSFILDYLKTAPEEKVVLNMIDGQKPAMFKDSQDFIYVAMPVSIG